MKRYRSLPPVQRLRELLTYDPVSGAFTWSDLHKKRPCKPAGHINCDGYVVISVDGIQYRAHRLAWTMHYGEPPSIDIDHVNRDTRDNRIANLRQATVSQNIANSKGFNKLGVKGVDRRGGSYRATIKVDGKTRHLGTFKTIDDASAAYFAAAKVAFGEFARAFE